jgi:hypothetical protein
MSAPNGREKIEDKMAMEAGPSNSTSNSPARQGSLKRKEPHDGFEEDKAVRRLDDIMLLTTRDLTWS